MIGPYLTILETEIKVQTSGFFRGKVSKPKTTRLDSIPRFEFLVFGGPHWWFFHGFENDFLVFVGLFRGLGPEQTFENENRFRKP